MLMRLIDLLLIMLSTLGVYSTYPSFGVSWALVSGTLLVVLSMYMRRCLRA